MKTFVFGMIAAFVVLMIMLSVAPFAVVGTTERGVVLQWGVIDRVMEPGLHGKTPIAENVELIDVSVRNIESTQEAYTGGGENETQNISAQIAMSYTVNPLMVKDVYTSYKTNENMETILINNRVPDILKSVVGQYKALELIDKRDKVSNEILERLKADMSDDGVIVTQFSIKNIDFQDAYEEAVLAKQVEKERANAQINITLQEEEKKKQEILKSEALSEKTRLEAAALASQNGEKVVAKIYAEAALEAAKKWNGQSPTTVITGGADGQIPLFPYMNVVKN